MSDVELKDCPFCGSDWVDMFADDHESWVACQKCDAYMEVPGASEERLAAAWNRRIPAQIKQMGEGQLTATFDIDDVLDNEPTPADRDALADALIAWAADHDNAFACEAYTVPFCLFCGALDEHHDPDCLHERAKALRDA